MEVHRNILVRTIPIERIDVVNPRSRGSAKFKQITASIAKLGLKRPITVARRDGKDGQERYDLVCGQGRLEAYRVLGQASVPAIVIEAGREQLLLMSLSENLARRKHRAADLAKEIGALKERGYDYPEIARKVDLDVTYVRGIVRLLSKGEERLLQAVERGQIPLTVAITIACSDDAAVQRALAEAYETKNLRGKALLKARRLIDLRRTRGKACFGGPRHRGNGEVSADKLLKSYQEERSRQRIAVHKAKVCESRLLFIVSALRSLLGNEDFVNLLRAQSLDVLPQYLAEQIRGKGT